MPLLLIQNDITTMAVDTIVNAANNSLLGGGGVDGCIHRAAGPELLAECRTLGGCVTGGAKLTRAYRLPCRYVIHTVGPRWINGSFGEPELLASCYRTSLAIAKDAGCETIAFPLISAGIFGYPKEQALRVALDTIRAFLTEHEMIVYLVFLNKVSCCPNASLLADVEAYIDAQMQPPLPLDTLCKSAATARPCIHRAPSAGSPASLPIDLKDLPDELDAGFSETLLTLIDRTGKTDAEIYRRANIDRKLFSKIRTNPAYKPSKATVLAFAIALELDLDETRDLLSRAGFALSRSSKFDTIIEYFISRQNYDVFAINEVLFALDQTLLGA